MSGVLLLNIFKARADQSRANPVETLATEHKHRQLSTRSGDGIIILLNEAFVNLLNITYGNKLDTLPSTLSPAQAEEKLLVVYNYNTSTSEAMKEK
jgi:hypothetical protein